MSKIYLYAEVLTNIRQVTLYASLQTVKNDNTRLDISSDRKIITVSHDGDSASIFLPTGIGGSAEVTLPSEKQTEIALRLELGDISGMICAGDVEIENEYPWPSKDLHPRTVLRCKSCKEYILLPDKIAAWKDLPSEHWVEMMDFWHCHKPHDEQAQNNGDEVALAKGYASSSKVEAVEGVGLVDVTSFLFAERDLQQTTVSKSLQL